MRLAPVCAAIIPAWKHHGTDNTILTFYVLCCKNVSKLALYALSRSIKGYGVITLKLSPPTTESIASAESTFKLYNGTLRLLHNVLKL